MDAEIARFMLRAAKLEFFLANLDIALARTKSVGTHTIVAGINWTTVAKTVEAAFPFAQFNFEDSHFQMLRDTSPQYLTITSDKTLKWDSGEDLIDSWDRIFSRSYAQLRNNIAHGNKFQLTAPFTHDRTLQFIAAAHALIDFVTRDVFQSPNWETPFFFG